MLAITPTRARLLGLTTSVTEIQKNVHHLAYNHIMLMCSILYDNLDVNPVVVNK